MRITIHNNNLEVVDHLDNSIPGSLKFYNDTLEMYLKGDAATFDFTVDKFVNERLQDRLQHLKANMFVSFTFEDMDFLMSVRNMTQNDYSMTFQCENASMELLNEYPKEFKQDEKKPMSYTIEEYLDLCQAFTRTKIRININQLADVKKVLSISSSTNIYGTILNLVETFGGECQIVPTMFEDGRGLKDIRINIFKAKTNTDLYSGIGTNREDVMLYMDRQVKGVSYTHDRTKQYTAVKIKDKDGNYYRARKNYIVKHSDGKHNEFYMMRNSTTMYAPLAMLEYPSMIHANECDNWTVQEIKTDLDASDHEGLYQAGLKALMEHAYGVKKYTIQLDGEKIRKKYRLTVGDVIYISDNNFLNGLLLRVRVEKISTSLSKPLLYKIEVSNVVEMASQLSSSMLDRYARMIEDAKPYTMSVLTSNGVAFKSLDDETRLYPRLYKGGKLQKEDTGRYFTYEVNDQVIGSGDSLDIKSKDYAGQEKIVVKVKGWDNGEVVFQNDITIFTVKDGKDAYSLIPSTSNGTQFVNGYGISAVSLKLLKGTEQLNLDDYAISWKMKHGNETGFSDFSSTNKQISVSTTDFVKTATYYATVTTKKGALIATTEVTFSNVQDGAAGTPGAVGRDGRQTFIHIAYANSAEGRKDFHVSDGTNKEYLGQYTDFVQADSNDPTRYTWTKIKGEKGDKGDRGNDGIAGKNGVGLRSTNITYGISDNENTQPANWTAQPPTLVKGKYLWTKTQWTYTDNTSEIGYQKTYIPQNGSNGTDGLPGKDGVGIINTTLRYCKSNNGVNKPEGRIVASFPDEIRPSRTIIDNNVMTGKFVRLEQGKTYILSAETNGVWTNVHNLEQSSNNATLWIVNPTFSTWAIISDSNTGTGTKYTHNRPTGDYEIRINSYHNGNVTWIKNIVFEDGTWTPDIPIVNPGEFLWTRTTWFYSDGTTEQGYSVAKMGETGPKGDRGEQGLKGADGRNGNDGAPGRDGKPGKDGVGIRKTTIRYGISDSDKTEPTIWTEQPPTLVKEKWFWTKTSWSYTDNTVETSVQKVYIPRNGNDGLNGIPGKDGVGIRSTVVDYAVSNDGVNRPTGGWSRQVPTEKLNFTWMRMTLTYTDNTSESVYTVSKNGQDGRPGRDGINGLQGPKGDQGLPGRDGVNGVSSYTHIAYADNQNGDGFSQTDVNKLYIGMYVDNIQQDSTDKRKYRWTKWRGQDGQAGVPGKPGADGRTPYVHFAYANSADGRSDFSLVNTNNKFRYIGHYTDFEAADSRDPSRYSWIDMTGGVVIGGDNLVRNSAFPKNLNNWGYWEIGQNPSKLSVAKHEFYYNNTREMFLLSNDTNGGVPAATRRFPVKRNTTYSLNVSMFGTGNLKKVDIYFLGRKIGETQSYTKVVNVKSINGSLSTTQVVRFENIFNSGECDEGFIRIDNAGHTDNGTSMLFFTELDVYEGATPRVWQASPYDLADAVESKADSALTVQQLQLLAEQDAKMRAELQAKAAADEVRAWIADYKNYLKSAETNRIKAESDLVTQSQRIIQLETSLGDMAAKTSFIDSFITQSNEGLTIGKTDGSSSIMFSPAGRISMFSSGKEVMYIDKGMLYIDNGTFVKTIQVGRYRTEQYFADLDMNVIRYVGDINVGGN
nr:MAG TPA: tail protein [Caudoviricetes sp.]